MDNFLIALNAIVPFLIYLGYGYITRRLGVFDEAFANKLNNVMFRLFFPFLIFYNIYNASWDAMPSTTLIVSTFVTITSLCILAVLVLPHLVKDHTRIGVIAQGIYRSNMLMYGLPLTVNIFGDEAAAPAAMIVTCCIAVYNVSAVIILEMFRDAEHTTPRKLLLGLCKNPLLQGAAVGLILFLTGIQLPSSVDSAISSISSMTSPLALFLLGATLHFSAIGKNLRCLMITLGIKMVAVPALLVPISYNLLGLRGAEFFLFIMTFATPVATATYPMSQNMGADGELAGQLVVISTALSLLTLFLWIYVLKATGLI